MTTTTVNLFAMSATHTVTTNKTIAVVTTTTMANSAAVLELGELYPCGQELLRKLTLPSQRLLVILYACAHT